MNGAHGSLDMLCTLATSRRIHAVRTSSKVRAQRWQRLPSSVWTLQFVFRCIRRPLTYDLIASSLHWVTMVHAAIFLYFISCQAPNRRRSSQTNVGHELVTCFHCAYAACHQDARHVLKATRSVVRISMYHDSTFYAQERGQALAQPSCCASLWGTHQRRHARLEKAENILYLHMKALACIP